jgi:hypothetical protein
MTTTLPASTRASRKRNVTFRFVTKVVSEFETKGVDVSVWQFEGSKVMVANANVSTVKNEPGSFFTSTSFAPFSGMRLTTKVAGRFNQKNLEKFADEVFDSVAYFMEQSEKFAAMFDPEWSDR